MAWTHHPLITTMRTGITASIATSRRTKMGNTIAWRGLAVMTIALGVLTMIVPAGAQRALLPNADGSNSTFSANVPGRPAPGVVSGTVSAVPEDFPDLRLAPGIL